MLGVIVLAVDQQGNETSAIYENAGGYTIFEQTMLSALKAESAHKVVAVAPRSQRRNITGGSFLEPGIRPDLEALKRRWLSYFSDPTESVVDSIYYAAQKNELSQIIVVHANCPLIPTWLINNVCRELSKIPSDYKMVQYSNSTEGVWITGMSYSVLADMRMEMIDLPTEYNSERVFLAVYQHLVDNGGHVLTLKNEGENEIKFSQKSLVFREPSSQLADFNYLLEEHLKGADINDLIEDLNVEPETDEV